MQNLDEQLIQACKIQGTGLNLNKIENLLENGASIDARDNEGRSLLHIMVENQNPNSMSLIDFLLEKGANIHAKDIEGKKPYEISRLSSLNQSSKRNMIYLRKIIDQHKMIKEQKNGQQFEKILEILENQSNTIKNMQEQIIQLNQKLQTQQHQSSEQDVSQKHPTHTKQNFF